MKILACAQIEILNNFLCVKVSLCIKYMDPNIAPCRESQQIATQYFETIRQSSCCLACGQLYFFYISLSHWQVLPKDK